MRPPGLDEARELVDVDYLSLLQLPNAQLAEHQGLGGYRLEVIRPEEGRATCSGARSVTYRVIAGSDHGLSTEAAQNAHSELLLA